MLSKKCLICGKEFIVKPWNKRKFCSLPCSYQYRRLHPELGGFKRGHIPWCKGKKMSKEHCYKLSKIHIGKHTGINNGMWNGGRAKHTEGYIKILKPEHPFCDNTGYVLEHRLVAEKYLNRYLTKQERIHHINEIRDDNHIENLYLFSNHAEHRKYHKKNKKLLISNIVNHNSL